MAAPLREGAAVENQTLDAKCHGGDLAGFCHSEVDLDQRQHWLGVILARAMGGWRILILSASPRKLPEAHLGRLLQPGSHCQ